MSDTEPLDLRRLPTLDPIEPPARFSQTFLRHADDCRRSAYLYLKYRGGTPGHALDRGSLAHAVFERMTYTLLEQGAAAFFDPEELEAAKAGTLDGRIASVTASIVDEVARERTDLTVPVGGIDAVRVMAYHWAVGVGLDVEKVVAVERKFVLDVAGWEITGKIDLAYMDGQVAGVDDYKTTFAIPAQEAFDESFQTKLYAALLLFGQPVRKEDGVEVREESIGRGIQYVRCRELYPRFLRQDGGLQYREKVRSRTELADFVADLERLVLDVERRFESGDWPAVPGSHCSLCPCKPECPLPALVREHAGTINTEQQARETAESRDRAKDEDKALQKELRNWVSQHGPLRFGKDKVLELVPEESKVTDWEGLESGVLMAREYGEPFELATFRKTRTSMRLKDRTLTADELAAERGEVA
jgi:hypothetical protein